jgi:hypothetical protein
MTEPQSMRFSLFLIPLLVIISCSKNLDNQVTVQSADGEIKVSLLAKGKVNFLQCHIRDSLTDSWPLYHPVFKLLKGDVNNDGNEDVAVGVIKSTRRDSVIRKRLFIYQIRNRSIIPLWLGSSLSHPMEDFSIINTDSTTLVRSIEIEKSNRYLIAEYEWFGFGLTFRKYLQREIELNNARQLLDQ